MEIEDLGEMDYRSAWARQEAVHAEVVAGGDERLLLVEHPPVITLGRRPGIVKNLLASPEQLAKLGVDLIESDRGGDITFHGPGQIVAYPIVRLIDHRLSVGGYVHKLESIVIDALAQFDIAGETDPSAVGVWTRDGAKLAKICAFGVRVRKGVTVHGLALNVTTDLRYFDLIVPCGLESRAVTSIAKLLGNRAPTIDTVRNTLVRSMLQTFAKTQAA